MRRLTSTGLFLLAACSSVPTSGGGSTGDDASTGSTSLPDSTEDDSGLSGTSVAPTGAATSTGADSGDESSSSGSDFITDPSGGCFTLPPGVLAHCSECDLWQQDCAEGEACKPWANDGGEVWNASYCGSVDAEPGQPGDPCEAEGSPWSGIDSCDVGGFCWNVDPDSQMGECVALCDGSEFDPVCPAGSTCVIGNDGMLPLCLTACDPLAPTCDEGLGCYPGTNEDFVCLRPGDGIDTNGLHTACVPGSFALVDGTCVPFCDLSAKAPCDDGFTCTPYFEGKAPAEYANVGGCLPTM